MNSTSIPKIIHYCWFGSKPLSPLEEDCLNSWQKFCPDYQIVKWDESSFDVEMFSFTKSAYELGKFAFVSDVARIWVLIRFGGVYLDTDMLLVKSLDSILDFDFFLGLHDGDQVGLGIIGSKPSHPVLICMLDKYKSLFFDPNCQFPIPLIFNQVKESFPSLDITFFPSEFFYPFPFKNRGEDFYPFITKKTIAVHLWNHSWKDEFAYLKEHRFWKAFSLFVHHIVLYPNTYLSKSFLFRFATESKAMLKQYLYFKLKGNRD